MKRKIKNAILLLLAISIVSFYMGSLLTWPKPTIIITSIIAIIGIACYFLIVGAAIICAAIKTFFELFS